MYIIYIKIYKITIGFINFYILKRDFLMINIVILSYFIIHVLKSNLGGKSFDLYHLHKNI